jgi:hypothetical protein
MKKTVVAIAIALTTLFSANAQEFRKNLTDEFTGVTKKVTNYYNIGNGKGYTLELSTALLTDSGGETRGMYFKTNADLGCAGTRDEYVFFKFTDGTTMKYKGIGSIDCGDDSVSIFTFNEQDFKNKTVEKIRFGRSEYYVDYTMKGLYTINQLINILK